jgi:hypothetical protein
MAAMYTDILLFAIVAVLWMIYWEIRKFTKNL